MKKIFAVLMILIALAITGCEGDSDTVVTTSENPFIGGTQGLRASFEPMGPEESGVYSIYSGETFPIQILLKNRGEYSLQANDVNVKLYGIYISDFSGIAGETLPNKLGIEGISELNTEGSEEIIDFGQQVKYMQPLPGTFYDANIFASYTYRYKTMVAVPDVCFKENLRDERVCKVDETKKSWSSAGPIQVKSVVEKSAGTGKVEVDFEIENVGNGEVTRPGIDFSPSYGQIAYQIEPETERANWRCSHAGRDNEARLDANKKATIRCVLVNALPKDALYTKQIGLTIDYVYRDIIQKTLRIKKSN